MAQRLTRWALSLSLSRISYLAPVHLSLRLSLMPMPSLFEPAHRVVLWPIKTRAGGLDTNHIDDNMRLSSARDSGELFKAPIWAWAC